MIRMNNKKLNPRELYSQIEKEFHDNTKLWGEIAKTFSDASLKLFDDTIKFVYQALTAMSLVMGFGFAGIQGVHNIFVFFIGEIVMFGSMMFGFYMIKVIYKKNADSVESTSNKIRGVFEKKTVALGEMMMELRRTGKIINQTNIQKYKEANEEVLGVFGIGKKRGKSKDESWFISYMITLFMVGFIFLLLSFSL
jgi:hypothetical protein